MSLDPIIKLVDSDLAAVDRLIDTHLVPDSGTPLIKDLAQHLINSGGKRLRPLLVLLSANACRYDGPHHITLAAAIEFIHTATLLHDDVVDTSDERRGRETANARWGNPATILVGDYLYSRAFQMMVSAQNMHCMEILAESTNIIAEGEIMQLLNCNDPDVSEANYLTVIRSKTARLFQAAAELGVALQPITPAHRHAMAAYGMHLGTAFQIVDDALDYQLENTDMGKSPGDDLAEGKLTLPLIYAMRHGSAAEVRVIRNAIDQGARDQIHIVREIIENTQAMEHTLNAAKQEADRAMATLATFDDSPYRDGLHQLAHFSIQRRH